MSDEQGDRAGFQPSAIAGPVSWGYAPGWYRARLRRFRATAKAEADSATLRNDKQEGCRGRGGVMRGTGGAWSAGYTAN